MSWTPTIPLQDGETVVLERGVPLSARIAADVITLGIYELIIRLTRFVITDRRVIVLHGPPGLRKVNSLPLDRVQDALIKQELWLGSVTLTTAGGVQGIAKIGPLTISQAREFANLVLERSRQTRDSGL